MRKRHYKHNYHSGLQKGKRHYHDFINTLGSFTFNRGIYRSNNGVFLGVCRGIAESFDLNVFRFRFISLILFIFTGLWSVGLIYLLAGLLMKKEPVFPLRNEEDANFYDTYYNSRESDINKIKKKFDSLNSRIQIMEDRVTSREFADKYS